MVFFLDDPLYTSNPSIRYIAITSNETSTHHQDSNATSIFRYPDILPWSSNLYMLSLAYAALLTIVAAYNASLLTGFSMCFTRFGRICWFLIVYANLQGFHLCFMLLGIWLCTMAAVQVFE